MGDLFTERRGGEIWGLVMLSFTVLVGVSLCFFHPDDPAWFFASASSDTPVQNPIGRFGAFVSMGLYQLIGLSAFLVPVCLGILGWIFFWGRSVEGLWFRAASLGVLVISMAGTSSLIFGQVSLWGQKMEAGGLAGGALSKGMLSLFNVFGGVLILVTVSFIATALALRFSYREAGQQAVQGLVHGTHGLRARLSRRRQEKLKIRTREAIIKKQSKRASKLKKAAIRPRAKAKTHDEASGDKGVQSHLEFAPPPTPGVYKVPPLTLLDKSEHSEATDRDALMENAQALAMKFREFGMDGDVVEIHPGPVVTMYEFQPAHGIKYSKIASMTEDLCLALRCESILINRISGKHTVGIEVPNPNRELIRIRDVMEDPAFQKSSVALPLALGKQIHGESFVAGLVEMPHLLVAGATGTGKSVAINSMIVSLLFKYSPDDLKFIFIDPKRIELGIYEDIPHLLTPVVYDAKKASSVLKWVVREMEERYKTLASCHGLRSRNIEQYNATLREAIKNSTVPTVEGEPPPKPLPYIVVIIDELADLMMVAARDVEDSIARLAQMARAVGIHLIIATQRPSVDIITGVIKANFPSRVSFRVSSRVDSRTILDSNGAEQLLGKGDMLYMPPGTSRLKRLHGGLITEQEVQRLVQYLKNQADPEYDDAVIRTREVDKENGPGSLNGMEDDLYEDAARLVVTTGVASISNLQRRFGVGYNRAARLIDMMEAAGIVGPSRGSKPRKLLMKSVDEFEAILADA